MYMIYRYVFVIRIDIIYAHMRISFSLYARALELWAALCRSEVAAKALGMALPVSRKGERTVGLYSEDKPWARSPTS